MDLKYMETAFDLLLSIDDFQKAEDLVSHSISQHPEKRLLLYLLAQAQWLNGNRSNANINYAQLLLCRPDKTLVNRLQNYFDSCFFLSLRISFCSAAISTKVILVL
jgi:hypothetical protein